MRSNVKKYLPVLRRQIERQGYATVRECLVKGKTREMSGKDRREALQRQILDAENKGESVC